MAVPAEPGVPVTTRATMRLWLLALLALLLVAGTAIGLYLTRFHEIEVYGDKSATLVNCPVTETVNCETVNTSAYSELLGTPISALGIPAYLLLLWMTLMGRRRPRLLAYAFSIGILAVLYSGFLYYVSVEKIGFLCVWCFRLYLINACVPVLAALAAWRNPLRLLGDTLGDLARFPGEMRLSAAILAALLVLTVAGDRLYRSLLPGPASAAQGSAPSAAAPPPLRGTAMPPAPLPATGPLEEVSGSGGKVALKKLDLKETIGKGRPAALIFYAPGYYISEEALVSMARFLKEREPGYDVFAVAGRREDQKIEMVWESFCLLDLPPGVPLLLDEGFVFSKAIPVGDVPDLVLVNGAGQVVARTIKGLGEMVPTLAGTVRAEQLIHQVAAGGSPQPLLPLPPYFPGTELYGGCAPSFTLPDVPGGRKVSFSPASGNGKPTFLMFWSATCKHCQQEIPRLLNYVHSHPGQFNLVSVAMIKDDRSGGFSHRKVTEAYIRSNRIPWTVLDDSSGYAADLYKVVSTPTTFLISPGGEIVDAWYYPHPNLEHAVEKALVRLSAVAGSCTPRTAPAIRRASFSVTGPDGGTASLDSLADRPSILHLWATWCAPCQSELPSLFNFRKTLEREGGRLLLVSVEDGGSLKGVSAYLSKYGSGVASFLAPRGGMADQMDLSYTVPRTFLLSPGGGVVREFYGVQPWEDESFRDKVLALLQIPKT